MFPLTLWWTDLRSAMMGAMAPRTRRVRARATGSLLLMTVITRRRNSSTLVTCDYGSKNRDDEIREIRTEMMRSGELEKR